MTETKQFHIGDVLTITDGKLVSPDHIGGAYNILGWMTGESLMTHQLPRVARECEPFLKAQHPELGAVVVPGGLHSREEVDAFLETLYPKFGRFVAVAKIPAEDHTQIDPIAELKMIRPDLPIIGIDTTTEEEATE